MRYFLVVTVILILSSFSGCAHFMDAGELNVEVLNIVSVKGKLGTYKYASTRDDSKEMAENPVTKEEPENIEPNLEDTE